MKSTQTPLPDGTHLEVDGDDPNFGTDSETGRTVRYHPDDSTLRNSAGEVERRVRARPIRRGDQKPPPGASRSGRRSKAARDQAGGRFHTLNEFVDTVSRYLEDTERATWLVLFRHADATTGTAEVGIDTVAEKVGRSTRSVIRAVERLIVFGLVERLHRGRRQMGPSRYRILRNPADMVDRIRQLTEDRLARKTSRRQRDTGVTMGSASRDRFGKFST